MANGSPLPGHPYHKHKPLPYIIFTCIRAALVAHLYLGRTYTCVERVPRVSVSVSPNGLRLRRL